VRKPAAGGGLTRSGVLAVDRTQLPDRAVDARPTGVQDRGDRPWPGGVAVVARAGFEGGVLRPFRSDLLDDGVEIGFQPRFLDLEILDDSLDLLLVLLGLVEFRAEVRDLRP